MTYPDRYGEEAHRSLADVLNASDDEDEPTEWECECGARNPADESECIECGAERPDDTGDA